MPNDRRPMLLSDNAVSRVEDDDFGFRGHAEILCDAIEATTQLPLTIGIFGPWGSGKSSFMNICRDLLAKRGLSTVTFNPWKYDAKEQIWHALIQTVLTEIIQTAGDETQRRGADIAKKLSLTATWLLARSTTPILTAGMVSGSDLEAAREHWKEQGFERYRHVNHFEEDFAEAVRAYTRGGRLVVFVDDLDRCTGYAAVEALDALKLFLGASSCVFVLAMDQDVIAAAAAERLNADEIRGRQYLEKLIHFPYHLPVVRFETVYQHLRKAVPEPLDRDAALWRLVESAFGENPRRMRRFVSALNLTAETLRLHSQPTRERLMYAAILLALRLQHPAFFALIQQQPETWERMDAAARGNRSAMHQDEVDLAERDPSLLRFLETVSPGSRDGCEFPPIPTVDQIQVVTKVLAVTGGATVPPDADGR